MFVKEGEKCFEESLVVDCVVWTTIINGFVLNRCFNEARVMLLKMSFLGLDINEFF